MTWCSEKGGRSLGGDRGSAESRTSTAIVAEPAEVGKQATPFLRLGACVNCGQRIKLLGGVTTCPTCSAWRRWYSAHRLASRYLREAAR